MVLNLLAGTFAITKNGIRIKKTDATSLMILKILKPLLVECFVVVLMVKSQI